MFKGTLVGVYNSGERTIREYSKKLKYLLLIYTPFLYNFKIYSFLLDKGNV